MLSPIETKLILRRIVTESLREFRNSQALINGGYLLKGRYSENGGKPLTLLYFGSDGIRHDFSYWFDDNLQTDQVSLAQASSAVERHEVDGVVVERSRAAEYFFWPRIAKALKDPRFKDEGTVVQSLVDLWVTCPGTFEDYLKDSVSKRKRNNIRRALKQPFHVRLSTEAKDIADMYERLLVPSTISIHGSSSHIPPLQEFVRQLPRLQVQICERDGTPLVANFVVRSRREGLSRLWRQGLSLEVMADKRLRSEAAAFADAQTIKHSIEEGLPSVSFGKSPCLSADGGFRSKLTWGCQPQIDKTYPLCYLYGLSAVMDEACSALGLQDIAAVENFARFPDENLRKAG